MAFWNSDSAPEPPDPRKTAAAQTATNVGTAIANQTLANVNQSTPYGDLTYNQTGTFQWTDPNTKKGKPPRVYDIPQFTATQTLSKPQRRLQNAQTQAEINLAQLGRDQSARIGDLLGKPMNFGGAPDVSAPELQTLGGGPKLGRVGDAAAQRMVGAGPQLATELQGAGRGITSSYGTDFSQDRNKVEQALMARMNPGIEQERERLESQLANQGIALGTEAYDRAMRNHGTNTNDARMGAILAGGQEQSRMVGMEANRAAFENAAQGQRFGQTSASTQFGNQSLQAMSDNARERTTLNNQSRQQNFANDVTAQGFNNQAAQQGFANRTARAGFNNQAAQQGFGNDQSMRTNWLNEQYAQRNQPLNEVGALLGTGQVQQPNFVNTPNVQMPTVDYAGLVNANYGQQMQAWQAQQGNPWLQAATGLGSAAIMASDRRLKTDVRRIGAWRNLPLYLYRYVWGGPLRLGVMAQDVIRVRPEAIVPMRGGYMAVDYGRL